MTQRGINLRKIEREATRQQPLRRHPLAIQHDAGLLAQRYSQRPRREREDARQPQFMAERAQKFAIRRWLWGTDVERVRERWLLDEELDSPCDIAPMRPGNPLAPVAKLALKQARKEQQRRNARWGWPIAILPAKKT